MKSCKTVVTEEKIIAFQRKALFSSNCQASFEMELRDISVARRTLKKESVIRDKVRLHLAPIIFVKGLIAVIRGIKNSICCRQSSLLRFNYKFA